MKLLYTLSYTLLLTTACLTGSAAASAAVDMVQGAALAKSQNCLACHTVDKKLLGPAYRDVAKKYKGDKEAEEKLIHKVKTGGSGVWGPIPMPANSPKVSDADIKTLVEWVLAN
jgi:cytochrome c